MLLNNMRFDAAVLCGGSSSRMGHDKALLELNGKSFINILLEKLSPFEKIYISCGKKPDYPNVKAEHVGDIIGCGPASGIHSVLSASDADCVFFVPCDAPLFSFDVALYLCSRMTNEYDVVVVNDDRRIHPLMAVYRKNCRNTFETSIMAGEYKVVDILGHLRVNCVYVNELPDGGKSTLNINTPSDYENIVKRIRK